MLRVPIFARLSRHPRIQLTVLHGSSVPNTKVTNGDNLDDIAHVEHWTIKKSGVQWVCHPFIWVTLLRMRPDVILSEGGSNFFTNFFFYRVERCTGRDGEAENYICVRSSF